MINGISYLAMIIAMIVLRQKPSAHSADRRKHPWVELLDGARYALSHPLIRSLLVLAALGSVFGGRATALANLTSAVDAVVAGIALSRGG